MRVVGLRLSHGTQRAGATLPEMLVALVVFGIVATSMVRALDRQARFHDGIIRLLEARSQLSATHDAVAAEVRGLAGAAGDLTLVTDSSLTFRGHVGSGIACAMSPLGIDLPAGVLASQQRLTHLPTSPLPGDSVWLLDEGTSAASLDDHWFGAAISSVTRLTGACVGTPYVHPVSDAATVGWRIALAGAPSLPPGVAAGAAVRITRHARFALYRSGGEFALGFADWNAATAAWNTIQPVSGAFVSYNAARPSASGVAFSALDSTGAPRATPFVAAPRLTLTTRSVTRGALRMDGLPRGVRVDSLRSTIAFRNQP